MRTQDGYPRKRARTRRQLVRAGMTVLATSGPDGATVGQVARAARVAPGTFYNHFPSLTELVEAISDEFATGVQAGHELLLEIEHDPAARVWIGTRQLLDLTRVEPDTARAFVALLATEPSLRARVHATIRSAVDDGIDAGRFRDRVAGVTADAVLGAIVQWMRSLLADDSAARYDDEALRMVLAIVGLPPTEIDVVRERVTIRASAAAAGPNEAGRTIGWPGSRGVPSDATVDSADRPRLL